jgi:uncharacterized protein (DUF433 family)
MAPPAALRQYTPQEAAALAGVGLQRVQNAITEHRLGQGFSRSPDGRRRMDLPAVLTFAAMERLEKVRIDPETLYRAFRETGLPHGPVPVTRDVTVDAGHLLETVVRNVELYEMARERIVSDPAIMGGLPVIRGTRLPARMIHARVAGGDSVDSIIEDYPYLDGETVEVAVMYVAANPERGRPKRLPRHDR